MAYLYCSHKKKHQIHNQILGTSSSTLFWSTLQGQQQALCVQRQREKEMSMCRGQVYKWPSMICIASSPRKVEYFFNLKQQQTQTMKKIKLTNPNQKRVQTIFSSFLAALHNTNIICNVFVFLCRLVFGYLDTKYCKWQMNA